MSQPSAWTQAQYQCSSTHLYPVIFHVLHTGHSDERRSPPVHCFQLHVDQEAVGRALEEPSQGEQGASGSCPLSSFPSTVSPSSPVPSPGLARKSHPSSQCQQEKAETDSLHLSCL